MDAEQPLPAQPVWEASHTQAERPEVAPWQLEAQPHSRVHCRFAFRTRRKNLVHPLTGFRNFDRIRP